ncbi:MAG: hypothetical protein WKF53_13165 [Rubrobacter sp.]
MPFSREVAWTKPREETERYGWASRGFAATTVAYGPARVGYGLFVPDFREAFGLSTGAAGLVGSGLQAGVGTIAGLGAGDLVGPLTLARPPASVTLPRPQTLPR